MGRHASPDTPAFLESTPTCKRFPHFTVCECLRHFSTRAFLKRTDTPSSRHAPDKLPKGPSRTKISLESEFTTGRRIRYGGSKTLRRVPRNACFSKEERQEKGTDSKKTIAVKTCVFTHLSCSNAKTPRYRLQPSLACNLIWRAAFGVTKMSWNSRK